MKYKVTIKFDGMPRFPQADLASLRNEGSDEGWNIMLDGSLVTAKTQEGFLWVNCNLPLTDEEQEGELEWRIVDNRHELYWNGTILAECMGGVVIPEVADLVSGDGVTSVEVVNG